MGAGYGLVVGVGISLHSHRSARGWIGLLVACVVGVVTVQILAGMPDTRQGPASTLPTAMERELTDTVTSLTAERRDLEKSLAQFDNEYRAAEQELNEIASPAVSTERATYNQLVSKRADVRFSLEKFSRLQRLTIQRAELDAGQSEAVGGSSATKTQVYSVSGSWSRKPPTGL